MRDARDLIAEHLALMAGKPGDIIITSGRPLRRGEVYCDGRELDRVTYARAFAAIGVSWGAGNGTTTFNIPDLRGCVLAASDTQGIRGNARRLNNTGAGAAGINATTVGSRGGTDRKSAVVGNLPADYAGAALDCAIVSDTSEVWQWSGSAWTNLADGSAPLPATYWHSEGASTGNANQSQNWGLHKWYDGPPVGIGGTQPGDYLAMLATMLDRRPPKFLQPLGAGVTDLRFSRFQAGVRFVPGTYDIPTS